MRVAAWLLVVNCYENMFYYGVDRRVIYTPMRLTKGLSRRLRIIHNRRRRYTNFASTIRGFYGNVSNFQVRISNELVHGSCLQEIRRYAHGRGTLLLAAQRFVERLVSFITRPRRIRRLFCFILGLPFTLPANDARGGFGIVMRHAIYRRLRILRCSSRLATRLQSILALGVRRIVPRCFDLTQYGVRFTVRDLRRTHLTKTRFACRMRRLPFIGFRVRVIRCTRLLLICLCIHVSCRHLTRPRFGCWFLVAWYFFRITL